MSKHMTIINLACTITKLRKWGEAWKHSAESAQAATARMHQAHETKMAEHRAAFGARTEADRKIIAGLREESAKCQAELDDFYQREEIEQKRRMDAESERNGLLTQVQDMRAEMQRLSAQLDWERAEIKRLQWENATMHKDAEDGYKEAIKVLGDPVALSKERDALRAEVDFLKTLRPKYKVGDKLQLYPAIRYTPVTVVGVRTVYDCQADGAEYPVGHSEDELKERYEQTPKHPAKVGDYVKRLTGFNTTPAGEVARVTLVDADEYEVVRPNGQKGRWSAKGCEPCDPPNHDTEAGKAAAESAVRTELVAEEIKVGDVAKVISASGDNTALSDIGKIGEVIAIDSQDGTVLLSGGAGWVSRRDVRKVTT